jgi:hypothetical protein
MDIRVPDSLSGRRKVLVETGERLSPSFGEQAAIQNGGDTPSPELPETEHLAA